jgi:hypothetical protein
VNCGDDAALGFTRGDLNRYLEAAYTRRLAGDAAGTMRPVRTLKAGESAYHRQDTLRWGDYSATCVDPEDDTTFWTIQEHAATSQPSDTNNPGRWGRRRRHRRR